MNRKVDNTKYSNLKESFLLSKYQLKDSISRLERCDNKFNILLVFLGVLFGALQFLIQFPQKEAFKLAYKIIIIIASIIMFISILHVFFGMFPRSSLTVNDPDNYSNPKINNLSNIKYYEAYINSFNNSTKEYNQINRFKAKLLKTSFVLTGLSVILFIILIVLKIL